jgi:hypothetical protein
MELAIKTNQKQIRVKIKASQAEMKASHEEVHDKMN